jgi:AcrR family transcriptional regulator
MHIRSERRDAVEHRRLILKTAQSLFDQHGVDSVSMHQIAKSAGIGQGTLYRRYNHKSELCFDLMKETFRGFMEEVDSYLEEAQGLPVRDRLEAVIRKVFRFLEDNSHWMGVIQRQTMCSEDQTSAYDSQPYQYLHSVFRKLLEEGIGENQCRAVNPEFSAHAFINSMSPDLLMYLQKEKGFNPEQLYDCFHKQFIDPIFAHNS